jgi:hypothetical protein
VYIFSDIIPPQDFSGSRNTQSVRHFSRLRSRHFAAGRGQPIVAAALRAYFGVLPPINLLDQLSLKERLDGTIQGSGPKAKTSASLLLNLAHDCVSVQVAIGEGKHNLERGGGQRIKFSFWHGYSMIDISMNDCTVARSYLSNRPWILLDCVAEKILEVNRLHAGLGTGISKYSSTEFSVIVDA